MIFSKPYKKWIGRCAVLLGAGTALQFFMGNLNPSFLPYPWGIVLAVNYLYLLIVAYTYANKWKWVKSYYDQSACIVSLVALLVLVLLFGLIRQDGSTVGLWGLLGFTQMSSSWIFILFLMQFMTVMGLKSIDDVYHLKRRKLSTVLLHVAFFVVLIAGVFGSGDKKRVKVVVHIGQSIQVGVSDNGEREELPFVLKLKDFTLEEYPPRIYRVVQNKLSKEFITMEQVGSKGFLDTWMVECQEYMDMAGRIHPDSAYASMNHVGATTAVYVKAICHGMDEPVEGWVSCGSHIFPGSELLLPDGSSLVMPRREVKKYLSSVELTLNDGKEDFEIAVNHPASVGAWKIYQSGYDSERGRWSTISVLECVRDAWYIPVYVALWVILAAGMWMLLHGWVVRKRGKEEDL